MCIYCGDRKKWGTHTHMQNVVDCPLIKKLPDFIEYFGINVSNCTNLEELPKNIGSFLLCTNCPKITIIKDQDNTTLIACDNCENLKEIKNCPRLTDICCENCRMLIFEPDDACGVECDGSPWVKHLRNPEYKNNINKLVKAQRLIKYFLSKRRIKNYLQSEAFCSWWYKPNVTGGKKAKEELEKFVENL